MKNSVQKQGPAAAGIPTAETILTTDIPVERLEVALQERRRFVENKVIVCALLLAFTRVCGDFVLRNTDGGFKTALYVVWWVSVVLWALMAVAYAVAVLRLKRQIDAARVVQRASGAVN